MSCLDLGDEVDRSQMGLTQSLLNSSVRPQACSLPVNHKWPPDHLLGPDCRSTLSTGQSPRLRCRSTSEQNISIMIM